MRIGCLQFSPGVGEVESNIRRADSILDAACTEDLSSLDLLVLPELALTGMLTRDFWALFCRV